MYGKLQRPLSLELVCKVIRSTIVREKACYSDIFAFRIGNEQLKSATPIEKGVQYLVGPTGRKGHRETEWTQAAVIIAGLADASHLLPFVPKRQESNRRIAL